jgi:kynurenine formamidase
MRTIERGIVDLTHPLSPSIPTWDGSCGFTLEIDVDYGQCSPPYLFRTQKITTQAGMGTHLDAPAHCFEGARTVDDLPLEQLIVPCVVIKPENSVDSHTVIDVRVFEKFEATYGKIASNTFVIVSTGWGRYWNTPDTYRNNLQFPSIHEEVANLLIERGVSGLGTDTLSADAGGKAYPVHRKILGSGKYLVENVNNSELLPPTGFTALVMPMKISEGTEAPVRLAAVIGDLNSRF